METAQGYQEELRGLISFRLNPGKRFGEFCERNFNNYDPDRFEAIAIRFFYAKEIVITLYALDKPRQEGTNYDINKLPVKKFKSNAISLQEFMAFVSEFNFTLGVGNFPVEDIQIINK